MGRFHHLVAGTILSLATLSFAQTASTNPSSSADPSQPRAFSNELMSDASGRVGKDEKNDNKLNVSGDLQFRYTANFGDTTSTRKDYQGGFSLPLTRLRFSGETNGFNYTVVGSFNRATGQAVLEDAYAGHALTDHSRVQFGQFKLPFMREVNVGDQYQLAAGRSITADMFGQGRSQGVQGQIDLGSLRLTAAFSDGFNTANTDYTSPQEKDYGATARADWVVTGDRDAFKDFTSEQNSKTSILLGGAGHYETSDASKLYNYTADASFKSGGFSVFGAGVGRNTEAALGPSFDDFGFVAQAAYRLTSNFEVFGRFDDIRPDSDRNLRADYGFVTAGVNYYIVGHAAKVTVDAVYAVNETTGLGALGGFSNSGLIGSQNAGETALRVQFQLLF
jgi:hypothetical protein